IHFNMRNHAKDADHALVITQILHKRNHVVHGCCTFEDDLSVLAAMVAEMLHLTGPDVQGIMGAKQKGLFYDMMIRDVEGYDEVDVTPFAVPSFSIRNEQNLTHYMKMMAFPLILKLEHGSGSAGIVMVESEENCLQAYRDLVWQTERHKKQGGSGLGFADTYVLMEYVPGSEHGVDLIIFRGELVAIFIRDRFMTVDGPPKESICVMPSQLSYDKQQEIIFAAYWTCRKLGLDDGVFNVDIRFDKYDVPKILEVNGRMGGGYIREWIYNLYNIDLVVSLFQVSLGIWPRFGYLAPCGAMAGTFLTNTSHSSVLDDENLSNNLMSVYDNDTVFFQALRNITNCGQGDFEKPRATLAVRGESVHHAIDLLKNCCRILNVNDSFYVLNAL
ncbi:hypothetical protein FSP39_004476, partial [Pinctada imbricata]